MELGFVSFNQEALNRAGKVLRLLQGQSAIDELGLGRVRDAFSNTMFPGLSTLQTHAKYFLILPALYVWLEKQRLGSARDVRARVRDMEIDITRRLVEGSGGARGIIGADTLGKARGSYVKYDPVYVYEAGLETYGFVKNSGNIYALLAERSASFGARAERLKALPDDIPADADESDGARQLFVTCGRDYAFGSGTPLDIRLDTDEARCLKERIERSVPDSFLAYLLRSGLYEAATGHEIMFDVLGATIGDRLPAEYKKLYDMALAYSRFSQALRSRYAMLYDREVGAADAADAELEEFGRYRDNDFDPVALSDVLAFARTKITDARSLSFIAKAVAFMSAGDNAALDDLIGRREREIKGVRRSKLANAASMAPGEPFVKAPAMSFRWNTIGRTVLAEIKEGLRR